MEVPTMSSVSSTDLQILSVVASKEIDSKSNEVSNLQFHSSAELIPKSFVDSPQKHAKSLVATSSKSDEAQVANTVEPLSTSPVKHATSSKPDGPKIANTVESFKCSLCKVAFSTDELLSIHWSKHIGDGPPYTCMICSKVFALESYMKKHILIHASKQSIECDVCGKPFVSRNALTKHMYRLHSKDSVSNTKRNILPSFTSRNNDINNNTNVYSESYQCAKPLKSIIVRSKFHRVQQNENVYVERISPIQTILQSTSMAIPEDLNIFKSPITSISKTNDDPMKADLSYTIPKTKSDKYTVSNEASLPLGINACNERNHVVFVTDENERSPVKGDSGSKVLNSDTARNDIGTRLSLKGNDSKITTQLHHFMCSFCKKTFASYALLRKHGIIAHNLRAKVALVHYNGYRCEKCCKTFDRRIHYSQHWRKGKCLAGIKITKSKNYSKQINSFSCGFCQAIFPSNFLLSKHWDVHIGTEPPFKCTICNKHSADRKALRAHLLTHSGRKYNCLKCQKVYKSSSGLTQHKRIAHSKKKRFQCDICDKAFPVSAYLIVHRRLHTGERPFSCEKCGKSYREASGLNKHKKSKRCGKEMKCQSKHDDEHLGTGHPFCKKQCKNREALKSHLHTHSGNKYECPECQKVYSHPSGLAQHKRIAHSEEKRFQCDLCDKAFPVSAYLTVHRRLHTGERPFSCEKCGKSYIESSGLIKHKKSKRCGKEISCKLCQEKFQGKQLLSKHWKNHIGEGPPYTCSVCNNSLSSAFQVKTHLLFHAGIQAHNCDLCEKKFSLESLLKKHYFAFHCESKQFVCDVCSKAFATKRYLEDHYRLHTGDQPFKCKLCERRYSSQSSLGKHIKGFHSDTWYKCSECDKAYRTNSTLQFHQRNAHNNTKYSCNSCGKSYAYQSSLARHHKDSPGCTMVQT